MANREWYEKKFDEKIRFLSWLCSDNHSARWNGRRYGLSRCTEFDSLYFGSRFESSTLILASLSLAQKNDDFASNG